MQFFKLNVIHHPFIDIVRIAVAKFLRKYNFSGRYRQRKRMNFMARETMNPNLVFVDAISTKNIFHL